MEAEIGDRIPTTEEQPVERRAHELLKALLGEQVGDMYPEMQEKLLAKADELFAEIRRREDARS